MGWQSKVHWANVVIMPYFPAIGLQLVWYNELAFSFKWRPSAIIDFKKFEILTAGPVRRANILCHRVKFRADRSNRFGDMAVFSIFQDDVVRYLGFLANVNVYVTFAKCYRRSVCLSVCDVGAPYSAGWNFRQFFSPYDSPGTLVFWCQNSLVGTPLFP